MKTNLTSWSFGELIRRSANFTYPDWQRNDVWPRQKKQKFVDTLLQEMPVPSIFIATFSDRDEIIVVDGRQRIRSAVDFVRGVFNLLPLTMDKLGLLAGSYDLLPEGFRKSLDNYRIPVSEMIDPTSEELIELFLRLQGGSPLSATERYNAVTGGFRDCCKQLTSHAFLRDKASLDDTRLLLLKIATNVLVISLSGLDTDLSPRVVAGLANAQRDFTLDNVAGQKILKALDFLDRAFPERSALLSQMPLVQSLIIVASRLVASGNSDGQEAAFFDFANDFVKGLRSYLQNGQQPHDADYDMYLKGAQRTDRMDENQARHMMLLNKMIQLSPGLAHVMGIDGDAAIFGDIVRQTARTKWSVTSAKKFETFLNNRESLRALYPDTQARAGAVAGFIGFYQGRKEPFASDKNLDWDAGILLHLIEISSHTLEAAFPDLKDNLLYSDALKVTDKDLARSMRRRGLYTLTALEASAIDVLFQPREWANVASIFRSEARLKDPSNAWATVRVKEALARAPAVPHRATRSLITESRAPA